MEEADGTCSHLKADYTFQFGFVGISQLSYP
jgi:hypothetical protein